jgi:hypothetical protein
MAKVIFPSCSLQKEIKNESMETSKNTQNTKNHNFGSNSFDHQFQ